MKKVLITGINGFAASQLALLLYQKKGCEIHGTHRVRSDMYRLEQLGIKSEINLHLIELTDAISVQNVIADVMPDQIYHLAAQDYVKSSWDAPHETFNTNVGGTINLFEAVRKLYPREDSSLYDWTKTAANPLILSNPKILISSTSETYGYHKERINEETRQEPINPYAISKCTQDQLSRLYSKAYNIPTVVTRAFNVTGWGRNDPFVDSNFAKQIAEIEKGYREPIIYHGNLKSKRTFFDVVDAVRGYYLAMESKYVDGDIFCFGASESTSIQKLLDTLVNLSTHKDLIELVVDEGRMRPVDTPDMRVDFTKASDLLQWYPTIALKQSLKELLEYWGDRV